MNKLIKGILIVVLSLAILVICTWLILGRRNNNVESKPPVLNLMKHSSTFNQAVLNLVNAYIDLKDAFVDWDTGEIKQMGRKLFPGIDSIGLDELKKDTNGPLQTATTHLSDIKVYAEAIQKESNITEMRQDFRMISEDLFPLLKIIHYEGKKLYWQNCPMAFGEGKDANWISNSAEIMNPYMGKFHPDFKSGMLHCGENKDSIQ